MRSLLPIRALLVFLLLLCARASFAEPRPVVRLTASDGAALLQHLDGHELLRLNGSTATLHLSQHLSQHLAQTPIILVAPSLRQRLLNRLSNPNLAVAVLTFGVLLIYLEFNVPGTIVPGAIGTLLIVLGLFGLSLHTIHYASAFLALAAIALIVLDAKLSSRGVLAIAGTAALIFGLSTLVEDPAQRIHPSVAAALGLGFGAITFVLAFIALKARRNKILTGPQALVGTTATVRTPLAPSGQVETRGEIWQARLLDPRIPAQPGSSVHVEAVEALTLLVSVSTYPKP